jgi:polyphosphate kinase
MSTVVKRETVHEFTRPIEVAPRSRSELFFNRELSLLEFHGRVLEEALDERNPLLERLKFLSIFSSNLDEFFMIRVSGLKEEMEYEVEVSPDGLTPAQQLAKSRERILGLVAQQARCLHDDVLPRLEGEGISVVSYDTLSSHEKERLEEYFTEKIFPVLTPLAVDPSHPFPYISPLSLNIGLMVDPPKNMKLITSRKLIERRFVRIKVPSVLPRLVPVTSSGARFVLLEEIIEANIQSLFPNMEPGKCHFFRVTRDADIDIRDEEAEDLLNLIQKELRQRRFGTPVRLEVS